MRNLDKWICPECHAEANGPLDVVNYEPDYIEGSHCPSCNAFIPDDDWIIEEGAYLDEAMASLDDDELEDWWGEE